MTRLPVERQVGRDFADDRRELETVAGKAAAKNDVRMLRMAIDHEIGVGREAVEARFGFAKIRSRTGHPFFHRGSDRGDIASHVHFAIKFVSSSELAETVKGGFHAVAEIGKPVEWRGQSSRHVVAV